MKPGAGVLAGISLVAVGVVGGLFAAGLALPGGKDAGAEWFPVFSSTFDDARGVTATLAVPDPQVLVLPATGRLTASSCVDGGSLTSGQTVAAVDGTAAVGLATRIPLWRDLTSGIKGDDVTALQEELNRLGETLTVDGTYGASTAAAVNRLWAGAGAGDPKGTLVVVNTMWLPTPTVEIEACSLRVGESSTGSEFATLARLPSAIRFASLPQDVTPGARTFTYSGITVEDDGSGIITSPEILSAMSESDTYRLWLADPSLVELTFTVDYALAEPLQILTVPPAAVGGSADNHCVLTPSGPIPVQPISSQLGQTYLTVDGTPPQEVRVPAAGEAIDCG